MASNPPLAMGSISPLMFDRVMEGRLIAAQGNVLLTLPVEILSVIINYVDLDNEALASLALVNSDCRQLARSFQFRHVVFNYSPPWSYIFGVLTSEAAERAMSENRLTDQPSLGACIRSISTSEEYFWEEAFEMGPHKPADDATDPDTPRGWRRIFKNMSIRMQHVYEPGLASVSSSLPHLETLI
ncbi:hypothetical protein BJX99DRAFT_58065 [Aspergillus californicus]